LGVPASAGSPAGEAGPPAGVAVSPRRVWAMLAGFRGRAALVLAVSVLTAIAEAFGISMILPIVDAVVAGSGGLGDASADASWLLPRAWLAGVPLGQLLGMMIAAFALKSLLMVADNGLSANFGMALRAAWTRRVFANLVNAEYAAIVSRDKGRQINDLLVEPYNAGLLVLFATRFASHAIYAGVLLILMLLTNWQASLFAGTIGTLAALSVWKISKRFAHRLAERRLAASRAIYGIAGEGVQSLREAKILGLEDMIVDRLGERLDEYTSLHTRFVVWWKAPTALTEVVAFLVLVGLIAFFQLWKGQSVAEIMGFLGFFLIVTYKLFSYVAFVIAQRMKIVSLVPSLRVLLEHMEDRLPQERTTEGARFDGLHDDIRLDGVSFAHDAERPVFRDLSLVIPKGAATAFVGPSGVGKSTLADLLTGLRRPDSGHILVNGQPLHSYSLASWRGRVGYVSQEPFIYSGSIAANLRLARPDADADALWRVLGQMQLGDVVAALPDGLDTQVGDRGAMLSGGQRQRLAIARTLLRDPDLLILDEATSALDPETAARVMEAVADLARGRTVIIISHQLSSLRGVDRIYRLEPGGAAVPTTFGELMPAQEHPNRVAPDGNGTSSSG